MRIIKYFICLILFITAGATVQAEESGVSVTLQNDQKQSATAVFKTCLTLKKWSSRANQGISLGNPDGAAQEPDKPGGLSWLFFILAFLSLFAAFMAALFAVVIFIFGSPAAGILFSLLAIGFVIGSVFAFRAGFKRAKSKRNALSALIGVVLGLVALYFSLALISNP